MARSFKIVIADDEADIRDYYRRLLPRLGHEVIGEASDGLELVHLSLALRPDLLVTDLAMPKMTGLEALLGIQATFSVPVIIVSSHEAGDGELHPSVVDYLVKPFTRIQLQQALHKVPVS